MLANKHSLTKCLIIIAAIFVTSLNGFHFNPVSGVYTANTSFLSNVSSSQGTMLEFPVLLGLYTSTILLPNQCLNFSMQSCNDLITCSSNNTSLRTIEFPYFEATGIEYIVNFTLSDGIQENTIGLVPSQCNAGLGNLYGSQSYGIIGLGTLANSPPENSVPIYFSIYLGPDSFSNVFLLNYDSTYSTSDTPVAVLQADSDWHVKGITKVQVGNNSVSLPNNTNLIFDMNFDAIGLPLSIYSEVIEQLNTTVSAICQGYGNNLAPNCSYSGTIEDLPNITISMNNQTFIFTPQVYVQNGSSFTGNVSTFNLNLRAVDNTLSGLSYVTPIYEDYIILGTPAMTYYYTVFNMTPTGLFISLYTSSNIAIIPLAPDSDNSSSSLIQLFIILAIVAACVFLYVAAYCYVKKHKKKENVDKDNETKEIALISISQSDTQASTGNKDRILTPLRFEDDSHSPGGPSPLDSPIKTTVVQL